MRNYFKEVRGMIEMHPHWEEHLYYAEYMSFVGFGKCCKKVEIEGKRIHSSFLADFTESDVKEMTALALSNRENSNAVIQWYNTNHRFSDAVGERMEIKYTFAKPIGFAKVRYVEKPVSCTTLTVVLQLKRNGFGIVTAYPSVPDDDSEYETISSRTSASQKLLAKLREEA